MMSWTRIDRRIGLAAAIVIVVLSFAYIVTGLIWICSSASTIQAMGLEPGQPFLAILEAIIVLLCPALVALFGAIHAFAPADRKTLSLVAFALAVLVAGITGLVHFVQLTVIRHHANKTIAEVFALYDPAGRLTPALAADLLAWDFFFGFALFFAASVFRGNRLQMAIRLGLTICGVLCLLGVSGAASGDLRLQYAAIVGYAFGFPFVCLLLTLLFARSVTES